MQEPFLGIQENKTYGVIPKEGIAEQTPKGIPEGTFRGISAGNAEIIPERIPGKNLEENSWKISRSPGSMYPG